MNTILLFLMLLQPMDNRVFPDRWSAVDKQFLEGIINRVAEPLREGAREIKRANESVERFSKSAERFSIVAENLSRPAPYVLGGLVGLLAGILFRRPVLVEKK